MHKTVSFLTNVTSFLLHSFFISSFQKHFNVPNPKSPFIPSTSSFRRKGQYRDISITILSPKYFYSKHFHPETLYKFYIKHICKCRRNCCNQRRCYKTLAVLRFKALMQLFFQILPSSVSDCNLFKQQIGNS